MDPSTVGCRVYIPFTFVAIKSFAFNRCEIYADIESEVTTQLCLNGSLSFNICEHNNIGIFPCFDICLASVIVVASSFARLPFYLC